MKKLTKTIISIFMIILISSCQKEEPLDITIHTFNYTMLGVTYVDKVNMAPEDVAENIYDSVFASSMLSIIREAVYLNSYEDYRALHKANDTPFTYDSSFFDEHSLLVIPVYSTKAPFFELIDFDLIDGKLSLSISLISSPIRNTTYAWNNYINDYYQILVEINRKDILDYDYQITELDQNNYFVYFGNEAYLESDYQIITDYQTFDNLFKDSSATWFPGSVLDLIDESVFDNHYVFAFQRAVGVYLNAQLYDYHVYVEHHDSDASYQLYITFIEDYVLKTLSGYTNDNPTLYLLIIPKSLEVTLEHIIIYGLGNETIVYSIQ
ncbi:MAG: hypothetical protein A2Y45_04790 [Tenericutes bacterium GWC2_34_14]|nr:MAG: hypothetical protein A2Y45_04790 [Tenericutes bacterium GWC2_34_14]OHE34074.1 MAG: hypothetical protein A2012_05445 [Tenericutes bacterium GWE2_34_108]OHE35404.1 MAG: hypothetical protein A2Y46_04790 [Tenericutes bacterium GWF1_35_14]OHE38450.1 MAG: hypothetical protein A2Y44_07955 [Tenericutes bacterium GWF2_35_184]OHE42600.1 MAG: hypothetical protein A3K26_00430 [Tenericutes bacterium RIFOXYA12_FULL_35_10]OHE43090.1 MAG: hypothetical protein A2221_05525 [Tenericutes bacterium RIFOXYA